MSNVPDPTDTTRRPPTLIERQRVLAINLVWLGESLAAGNLDDALAWVDELERDLRNLRMQVEGELCLRETTEAGDAA